MYRYSNGQISFGGFQTAGGYESEGKQPLGKESPDDPLTGDREALRRTIHQPERQCGQAAASGLGRSASFRRSMAILTRKPRSRSR